MLNKPIGVFDSGYGGLTILKEIVERLPQYNYLYMGDNARAPYGPRSFETVYDYTLEAVKWFFSQGCSLVILACNTASAKALRSIQQKDLPQLAPDKRVLGVIRPTAEVIGYYSKSRHVGVLGTQGTVSSQSYLLEIEKFFPDIAVSQEACPEWVPIVENNAYDQPGTDEAIQTHLDAILQKDPQIDTLLLACTHYPMLMEKIRQFTPEAVSIIAQGGIIAQSLEVYLQRHPEIEQQCGKDGQLEFYTTGSTQDFDNHTANFFGRAVSSNLIQL
ncbi:glutamate racemase [Ferruginibacter sp. HRS2-29]|uniref:glutamate racemase n=1 Tax=Ferruginibacter sp. HRS2-29 TaxID=2487334 RepID=UPI0020CF92E6|nr:glutamate racemase [Ferruginibacter sp. HRS2-29]MCP9750440.1 glutamate racemase [Ferruginibacter sp. HRS2-29]